MKRFVYLFALATFAFSAGARESRTPVVSGSGLKQVQSMTHSTVQARRVAAAAENVVTVPFSYSMGKDSPDADFIKANFTVINANNDSRKWNVCTVNKYSACMAAKAGESENADDWLITMPVKLEAGSYKLTFESGFMGSSAKGYTLGVSLGTEPTVEAMTTTIAPDVTYTVKDQTAYQYDFSVAEAGVYYIGFHCTTSVADAGAALLYTIALEANAPAPENAIAAPFKHGFGKESADKDFITANYAIIDANKDGRTWKPCSMTGYTPCMLPNTEGIDEADDWFITVPVYMTAGDYKVGIELGFLSGSGVKVEAKLGTAPTVEAMIAEIMPATEIKDKANTVYEYACAIPSDGYYYIGIHNVTPKTLGGTVKLVSLSVEAGEVVVVDPPAAGTLSWVLAPKGELKATVTYTAPTKTVSGADLESISKVELTSRWTVDKYEFTDVKPGQVIVQDVEMYQGINNRFTGVAYVDDTPGEMVEYKSIFCGKDTPLAPTNVKLATAADYTSAVLTWDAVSEVGENGGYVDPEAVTYYIFDAFGSYYDPAIGETNNTSATLSYTDLDGQDFVAYQVTAGYEENYSKETSSNIVIVGTPFDVPFTESFGDGYYENMWALDPATTSGGQQYGTISDEYFASLFDPTDPDSPEPLKSFDGDNGFLYWLPYENDVVFGLLSLRTDISKAANPVLEFRYQGQGNTIDVFVAKGTGDLELVKTIKLKDQPTDGWALAQIPLSEYKAAGAVNFEIRLTANDNDDDHTWSVPVDHITVRDLVDVDMRVVTGSASATSVAPGEKVTFKAHVHHQGSKDVEAVAHLYVNENKVDEKTLGVMTADSFGDVEFEYTVPLNAPDNLDVRLSAVADGDAVETNNHHYSNVAVKYAPYPGITDLAGTPDEEMSKVHLTWNAPVLDNPELQTIFEDFESADYTAFSISGVGGWTVYDGDGERTINVFNEKVNPNQTAPMAFQLFNRDLSNPQYIEDCTPHSGTSFMLAPTAYYADNDNWLISPRLSGNEQTISFYAKSFSSAWPEALEVFCSKTGNTAPTDFAGEALLKVEPTEQGYYMVGGVPEEWTKYEVTLPAGAQYFAIHHFGFYTCALFIDDVTYEAAPEVPADLEVVGYHVMRDDKVLTDEPVKATEYTDEVGKQPETIKYTYSVVPVYNYGVARGQQVDVEVQSAVKNIDVERVDGEGVYYNLQGVRVDRTALTPGIYIRVNGGSSEKVIISKR